jgi:TetR/AcrR family transcriptional regulator, fatty acid biosynthesis regulator
VRRQPLNTARGSDRRRRTRLTADQRRSQLLDSAARLLETRGFAAVTMEALGAEAGTSKTLGYAYFDNVEHVLAALRSRELEDLYRRVEEAAATVDTFDEKIGAAVHAYFDIVVERGRLLGMLESARASGGQSGADESTNEFIAWFAGLIAAEFNLTRGRATAQAAILAATADVYARVWGASRYGRQEMEEACVRYLIGGIRGALSKPPEEPTSLR